MYHLRRLAVCLLSNVGIKQFPVTLLKFLQLFLCHLKVFKLCQAFKTRQEMTSFKEMSLPDGREKPLGNRNVCSSQAMQLPTFR